MRRVSCLVLVIAGFGFHGCSRTSTSEADLKACEEMVAQGFLRIAESREIPGACHGPGRTRGSTGSSSQDSANHILETI